MVKITNIWHRFRDDEAGAVAIEYGLILALMVVVIIGGASLVGTGVIDLFTNVSDKSAAVLVP